MRRLLSYVALTAAVAIAFAPGLGGAPLHWDDDRLAYDNPLVGPPYAAHTLRMFTTIRNEAYQPLHVASYQLDRALWGLDPLGTHLLDLALYALGVALLFAFLVRLGAPRDAALCGMLLFALHPAHVESVAWISGRKDVLSLVFVALALLLHVGSSRPFDRRHLGSLGLFVLAALTKTTTLFLPLFLPLLDRWALRRSWRSGLLRAAPMAAVAGALGALVAWIWHVSGLTRTLAASGSRFALAPKVLLHYATTLVWPAGLSPLYPIDRVGAFDGRSAAGLALLGALVALAWKARREAPGVALGAAIFLLGLLPVSNLVPLTFQVNDRYLLLPSFGLALGAWGYASALEARPLPRRVLLGAVVAAALACGVVAFRYAGAWRSDLALWERATRVQPDAYYAWMKLGETQRDAGRFDEADAAYARAIAREPSLLPARGGRMLACLERADRARGRAGADELALAGRFTAAWGDAEAMLDAAQRMFTAGDDDCAFDALLQATEVHPPLSDDVLLGLAGDWLGYARPERALLLLDRVSPAGRGPAWRDLLQRATTAAARPTTTR